MTTLRVIFVCSGNICRSPLAEVMAKAKFDARGARAMTLSMGTLGIQGRPAATNSRLAAAEIDLDLTGHRSQGLQTGILEVADWIVVMEEHHARDVAARSARLAPKIVRLWEFIDEDLSGVPDPVGQDIGAFRLARERIDRGLDAWIDQVAVE